MTRIFGQPSFVLSLPAITKSSAHHALVLSDEEVLLSHKKGPGAKLELINVASPFNSHTSSQPYSIFDRLKLLPFNDGQRVLLIGRGEPTGERHIAVFNCSPNVTGLTSATLPANSFWSRLRVYPQYLDGTNFQLLFMQINLVTNQLRITRLSGLPNYSMTIVADNIAPMAGNHQNMLTFWSQQHWCQLELTVGSGLKYLHRISFQPPHTCYRVPICPDETWGQPKSIWSRAEVKYKLESDHKLLLLSPDSDTMTHLGLWELDLSDRPKWHKSAVIPRLDGSWRLESFGLAHLLTVVYKRVAKVTEFQLEQFAFEPPKLARLSKSALLFGYKLYRNGVDRLEVTRGAIPSRRFRRALRKRKRIPSEETG